MPIVKIPLQHKFGIVSLSRAENLLAQTRLKSKHRKSQKDSPGAVITQKFVTKYNDTAESMRDGLDASIQRALLHSKYKVGLLQRAPSKSSSNSTPLSHALLEDSEDYVDISSAWLELTMLCQCHGQYQQDALLTLATSLNHAPLSKSHIPSLLYIAGLCYQWLKTDDISGNLLRTGELLLLKILYLVSLRIHYHHLIGVLVETCTREEVRQMKFDLEGFENREKAYRNYPVALLYWKVALEVGLLVCENYSKVVPNPTPLSPISSLAGSSNDNTVLQDVGDNIKPPSSSKSRTQSVTTQATPSHSGSGLAPILWHTLDVWQCMRYGNESLGEATGDLLNCSTDFNCDKWMEGALAMCLLCVASQISIDILTLLQSLASGTSLTPSACSNISAANEDSVYKTQSHSARSSQDTVPSCSPNDLLKESKRETRFKLPPSVKSSPMNTVKGQTPGVRTLNMLGMQPDFDQKFLESAVTLYTEVTNATSERSKLLANPRSHQDSYYSTISASTIGTQSLIRSELIPDTLPSTLTSNTTMVDFGESVSALDDQITVNMSKSAAFLASSNSKSLNISNLLSVVSVSSDPSDTNVAKDVKSSSTDAKTETAELLNTGIGSSINQSHPALETVLSKTDTEPVDRVEFLDSRFPTQHEQEQQQELSLLQNQQRFNQGYATTGDSNVEESRCTHYTHSTAPLSDGAGVPGSQVAPSTVYRRSIFSTPVTDISSEENKKTSQSGFEAWSNEIALLYTIGMADIVIYGQTTMIQKVAFQGKPVSPRKGKQKGSCRSNYDKASGYGLLHLSECFKEDLMDGNKSQHNFYSWAIRHSAVLGLSRICKVCQHVPVKDGFSTVAWKKLTERHSSEKEDRVLEAYKLSQACPDLDSLLLSVEGQSLSSPLLANIADSLSQLFLPPVPTLPADVVRPPKLRTKSSVAPMSKHSSVSKALKNTPPRVCTKNTGKVPRATSFNTRTMGALNKIAEGHWRRQMEEEKQIEEQAKIENEKRLEKEYQEKVKRKQETLAQSHPKQSNNSL